MDAIEKRISRAWQKCKGWITEFDGSATQTYLTNIAADSLAQAFNSLATHTDNFRVSTITGEGKDFSQFVRPESIQNNIILLQKDEIAGLNINFTSKLDGFDLDIHMIVETIGQQKVDLEMVWWADQVFSEDSEAFSRFKSLVSYFIALQGLFNSSKLFIGPETLEKPAPGSISWIEI